MDVAESIAKQRALVGALTRHLTDEIVTAIGFSPTGWAHRLLAPAVWLPAHRFATLVAHFDQTVRERSVAEGARWLMSRMVADPLVRGSESIPREGPLLIASNHPGSVDGLAITSQLPRNDIKVVVTGIPFFRLLPGGEQHLIYVPRQGTGRMTTVREMLRHLGDGGALLVFPRGNVEPDPAILPGACDELREWSPSLELVLRRQPDTQVLLTMVSGVLSPRWLRHPLVRLRDGQRQRQLLAEFLQTMQQLVLGRRLSFAPRVTFAPPIRASDLRAGDGSRGLMASLIERSHSLLHEHLAHHPPEAVQDPAPCHA